MLGAVRGRGSDQGTKGPRLSLRRGTLCPHSGLIPRSQGGLRPRETVSGDAPGGTPGFPSRAGGKGQRKTGTPQTGPVSQSPPRGREDVRASRKGLAAASFPWPGCGIRRHHRLYAKKAGPSGPAGASAFFCQDHTTAKNTWQVMGGCFRAIRNWGGHANLGGRLDGAGCSAEKGRDKARDRRGSPVVGGTWSAAARRADCSTGHDRPFQVGLRNAGGFPFPLFSIWG